jgi:hypothetical protein
MHFLLWMIYHVTAHLETIQVFEACDVAPSKLLL